MEHGRQGNNADMRLTLPAVLGVEKFFVSDQDVYLLLAFMKLWQANLLVCKQGKNLTPFTVLNSPRTPTVTELT